MTFSQPTQSPGSPSSAAVLPMLFRLGDDWVVPVALANGVTGDPVDLTGAHVSARLYCPFPVDVAGAAGSLTVTSATEGALTVIVASTTTGGVNPQTVLAKFYPCRLSITVVDTLGHKHTYDPIPILPLKPQDDAPVPTQGQVQVLTTYQQGPAGASNSLTAAQINALVAAAVAAALAGQAPQSPSNPSTGLVPPAVVHVPTISGVAQSGQLLTGTIGTYTGTPTPDVSRQWFSDDAAIAGAIGFTYYPVDADVGNVITLVETAVNSQGAVTATSAGTAAVVAAPSSGSADFSNPDNSGLAGAL